MGMGISRDNDAPATNLLCELCQRAHYKVKYKGTRVCLECLKNIEGVHWDNGSEGFVAAFPSDAPSEDA